MMANITLTELMINSFLTGILNVVASACITHCAELNCSFAVKVN